MKNIYLLTGRIGLFCLLFCSSLLLPAQSSYDITDFEGLVPDVTYQDMVAMTQGLPYENPLFVLGVSEEAGNITNSAGNEGDKSLCPLEVDCSGITDALLACRGDLPPVDFDLAVVVASCGDATKSALTIIPGNSGCPGDEVTISRTYFVQDEMGNMEQCGQTFTVRSDQGPVITCPADSLIDCGVTPTVSAADATATFDCSSFGNGANGPVTVSGPVIDGTVDSVGTTYTFTFSATDGCGRTSSCDQVFTVQDTIAPQIISCVTDTTIYLDETGVVSITPGELLVTTDDCVGPNVTVDDPLITFGCESIGQTFTFDETDTDPEGNTSETCTISVTVQDTLGPVISQTNFINLRITTSMVEQACPGNTIFVDEGLNQPRLVSEVLDFFEASFPSGLPMAFFTMLFEDNCTEDEDITVLITSVENFELAEGADSVVINGYLIDEQGNRSVLDTATIVLVDDTDPELACQDVTVFIDENGVASVTDTLLAITSLSDNCTDSAAIDIALVAPELGCDDLTGTATLTATDASGNTASCTISLMPADTIRPEAVCLDITVELDAEGNASIATDGAAPITEITGALEDTDPTFNGVNPFSSVASCLLSGVITDAFYDEFSFSIDATDTYTFTLMDDGSVDFVYQLYEGGFDPNDACANLIALGDDEAGSADPEIMIELTLVPGNYTLVTTTFGNGITGSYTSQFSSANGGAILSGGGVTTSQIDGGSTDNCSGALTFAEDITEFTCDDLGDNTVTLTVTDGSGNANTCTATVTVEDNLGPVLTVTDQLIVLNDGNTEQTLTTADLATATDNCDAEVAITFDRDLTFDGDDIGTNTITVTATDAEGNETVLTVTVVVTFDQPNLACIGEINLTLNDDCQGLLIPEMLLTGNVGLLDAFDLEITVMDNDPSNGPIVDGCGSFQYMISDASGGSIAPVEGFTGAFAEENWTVVSTGAEAAATFTATSLEVTSGVAGDGDFSNSDDITVSYQFSEAGTVSFDADYFVETEIIEDIIIVDFDGNIIFQSISDEGTTGPTESGSFSVLEEVPAGATLMVMIEGDDFTTSGNISRITLTNFLFQPEVSVLALDFETCWGIVNAEDKTPPAIVSTPDDVALLCVDLDGNNLSTLPNTTSKCYRVSSATGATIPGSMAPALRVRLLAGGLTPLVPTFTDGCTEQIEVCVNDVVAFGDDPSCDDVVITRTFTATEIATCASAAGEANESVVTSFELTFERPTLADLSAENIDQVVEIERCGTANPTRADYPAPRPSDFPFLVVGERTFPLSNGGDICNIGVTFSDGEAIVTCPFTYKFVRTYTVIDWCDPSDIRTFTQVVKVGDTTAPDFAGPVSTGNEGALVYGTNAGNVCAAYLRLDDVSAVDNCSGTNVSISAEIFLNRDLNSAPIGAFVVIPGGTPELSSAIPVGGPHILRYTYSDECGNTGIRDYDFFVEDQTPPVAICEDGLNISIAGGTNDGFAVLAAANIDAGSYDDCSGITRAIARVNANDLAIGGYADQITLTCADIGIVRVGLRVTDALGNENFCWLDVLVEDKLIPTCIAPGDVVITCDEYNTTLPADIMDASNETLDALFGAAAGVDNCGVTITQSISGDVNSCGVGSFVRTFVATDDAGFTNNNSCRQNIRVDGVHDYRLTFPTDESSDCAIVPEYDGIMAEELACDLITTTTDVDTLRTLDAGDECFKLRITYDVVNWCEYNSFGEPYLVPRDGDGVNNRQRLPRDLEADVLYLNVLPGATTTTTDDDRAFMTLFTDRVFSPNAPQNDQPVDDNLLSDGDDNDYGDNDVDSRGFFRYVQFVKIYDEVAPEITFTEPAECFAGNNEDCSGTVELTFTAVDACSDAVVGVELDADFDPAVGFVRTADITGSATNDGEGNFTVSLTNIPVGEHAIRVRASDGCGNFDVQIIEFCVEADRTPTPICIQTLTVTLMNDGNGGGIAAIWASDFIASPIVDCFGNPVTKYSLYRTSDAEAVGFNPVAGIIGIDDIDCADRGDLNVRVYAFDDNGSTPDFCEVVVEVQDNEPWCGGTGDLSGLVLTPADEALAGVLMTLTGGMDATTTTDENGAFEFRNLAFGGDYTVQPGYDAPFSNRDVKTSDLVAAIGEILGTQPFDSPYDYIAADVNRDGEHDVRDVVMSSRAILGITNGYPAGNWSFTTADAVININNPYGEAFPEVYNVNDLQGSFRAADFVAIMMGDLVSSNGRSAQTLNTEDVRLEAGQPRTVVLDGAHLAGFQGTLELAAGLELVSADYAGEGGMNLNRAAEGLIAVALRNEASLMLEVRATEAGLLSELIALSDAIAVREGVAANGTSNALELAFSAPATAPQNALYQNTPNPVRDVTSISFELAEAGAATLTVRDVAGRLIVIREVDAVAGLNRVELEELAAGVLTYTLTSGDFVASRKMVVVK